MSNTDNFIDEVAEEVRNDWLYALFRKYAWVGAVLIVLVVAGAAGSEYFKARNASEAQAAGDALSDAFGAETPAERAAALAAVADVNPNAAFLAELARASELAETGQIDDAKAALEAAREAAPNAAAFQDMIDLKAVSLPGGDLNAADRLAILEPLIIAGRPYRLMALEQTAYAHMDAGDTDAAITALQTIAEDAGVTQNMRARAEQMILVLGGSSSSE